MRYYRTIEENGNSGVMEGDRIRFRLADGEEAEAFCVKITEDGAGLFIFTDCLKNEYRMNPGWQHPGWEACELRGKLNGEILEKFPEEIRSRMKPFPNGDLLRIPTEKEIFGENPYGEAEPEDVKQFDAMRDRRNRIAFHAYDRRDYEEFQRGRKYNAQVRQEDLKPAVEDGRGKKWLTASEIKITSIKDAIAIPTGIPAMDRKIMGLILGEISIVTGSSGAGKSTFLNHLILTAVQRNYRVGFWSGEMKAGRVLDWIHQMAAGKAHVELVPGTDGLYSVPGPIRAKINTWLGDRLHIYNNAYGQKWSQLRADIEECVKQTSANLILLDNLMALTIDNFQGENNDRQSAFINDMSDLAKRLNVHILLVCHPRKENVNQLIRKESVAGTADLTNRVDSLFLLHRVNRDFERRGKEFFGPVVVAEMMQYNLVIEMNKARTAGYQDQLFGLYYEQETRRLKNDPAENIVYGWDDTPVVDDLPEDLPDFLSHSDYYNKF